MNILGFPHYISYKFWQFFYDEYTACASQGGERGCDQIGINSLKLRHLWCNYGDATRNHVSVAEDCGGENGRDQGDEGNVVHVEGRSDAKLSDAHENRNVYAVSLA